MGLFSFFKRKKYDFDEEDFEYEEYARRLEALDLPDDEEDSNPANIPVIDFARFNQNDIGNYVRSQCEAIEDLMKFSKESQSEYEAVTDYFTDIQIIDSAPENTKEILSHKAKIIADLTVDRRIYQTSEGKLSYHKYHKMEEAEGLMPDILVEMQNNEARLEAVKKDMRLLEGERMSIRYDIKDGKYRKKNLKTLGVMAVSLIVIVLIVLFILGMRDSNSPNYAFLVTGVFAAIMIVVIYSLNISIERQSQIDQKKYAKCVNLLNKVKIKYVNAANILDYQYEKFEVKNSYEFSKTYETYLTMKAEQKKVLQMTQELNKAEEDLIRVLTGIRVKDPEIWLKQVKALIDPKEMVEIRHNLSMRRQKLRGQIEFNNKKVEECKGNIKRVTINHPQYKDEVMLILEKYELYSDY